MGNIRSIKKVILQLNYILSKRQRRGAILLFVCMIIGSSLELLGVSAIYPFLQMLLESDGIQSKWYTALIYHIAPRLETHQILLFFCGVIIVVYLLKNIFLIFSAYIQHSYAAKFQRETSTKMLEAYLKRPYQYFLNTNSGIIINGVTRDIEGAYQILLAFFTMLSEVLTVVILGIFLLMTDWITALSAMLLAMLCFLAIVFGFKSKMKKAGKDRRNAYALTNQYGYQAISGIKEITVLNRRKNFVKQFEKAALLGQKASIVYGFLGVCPDRILEGVCIAGFMGIVCIRIAIGTDVNEFVPVLGTFAMGAFRILPSVSKISSRFNTIVYYQASLQNTYDNLRAVEAYDCGGGEAIVEDYENNVRFTRELLIKEIDWKYQNAKENVLENASLKINKGEAIALIGSSGAGKTTLADIIMGLLKPQQGMVEMDGIDIFSIPQQWCRIIGYVPQSVFLIDDTVRCNVAFGLEEENIDDEKVWAALDQAQLKDFVKNLPNGLDTIVGERGIKFSGGQRQRIAIARALYEDPDILVLDEATSALDNETETAVMESIDALQRSKTLIIVAHRLTTIRNCDRIYEITDGAAVERSKEEIFK